MGYVVNKVYLVEVLEERLRFRKEYGCGENIVKVLDGERERKKLS